MEQVNVVVVGAGDWGRNLIKNFCKLANLVGVCDSNQLVATKVASEYRIASLSWQQILAQQTIDAVIIASNKSHFQLVKEALLAGKHVFVEKPLAPSVKQAKELCAIALKTKKKLMVGHLLQYHPVFTELKKLCAEGYLGELLYAYSNRLAFGKFMPEENVLLSLASHDISMILSLMGKPQSIDAFGNCFLSDKTVDQAIIKLKFTNQRTGHIFVSWLHPVKERKFVVIGTKAMLVFDDLAAWDFKLGVYHHNLNINKSSNEVVNLNNLAKQSLNLEFIKVSNNQEPLFIEVDHFIKCIKHDLTPNTDGMEALAGMKVIEKASKKIKLYNEKLIAVNE